MQKELLRLNYLSKKTASCSLFNLNLTLREEEILGVISVRNSERHCLVDLINAAILPDRGYIYVENQERRTQKRESCIAYINMKSLLIPNITVAENLFLPSPRFYRSHFLLRKKMFAAAKELLDSVGLTSLSPTAPAGSLSLAMQHAVQILKALSVGARILVLDNICSLYTHQELEFLQQLLLHCKQQGTSVLFIVHQYTALFEVADRACVLYGTTLGHVDSPKISKELLLSFLPTLPPTESSQAQPLRQEGVLPHHIHLIRRKGPPIDLEWTSLQPEVLGFFSRDTHDQLEPPIPAIRPVGSLKRGWRPRGSVRGLMNRNIGLIYEDRTLINVFFNMNLWDNLSLQMPKKFYHIFGFPRRNMQQFQLREILKSLGCQHLAEQLQYFKTLPPLTKSDQMKLCIARWLCINPHTLVFYNPQVCFNDLTIVEFQSILKQLKGMGITCLIFSVSQEHLIPLCDRIVVIESGRIVS